MTRAARYAGPVPRCPWARNELAIAYHDREWGVPLRDDRALFELLMLEGAQAGLSWDTILRKRARYREVFDGFDARRIAGYDARRVASLLADPGIVRNRLKIRAAIDSARAFLGVQEEFGGPPPKGRREGGFTRYIWSFVDGEPIVNKRRNRADVPARTDRSDAMSKELKRRGFRFVGSTICYAFMQAAGLVNDHLTSCPRHLACMRKPRARSNTRSVPSD